MSEAFDVAVIGGGPAGCATALTARAGGLSVAILERSPHLELRVGEVLPPAVRSVLDTLGLWDAFLADGHVSSPAIRIGWGDEALIEQNHFYNPHGVGWHIDRARFDGMLMRAAEEAGVFIKRAAPATFYPRPSRTWLIGLQSGGDPCQLQARFLVDATGRSSAVARQLGLRRLRKDNLIGVIGCFAPGRTHDPPDAVTLIEAATHGWWYSASMPDSSIVVCYLTDADLYARDRHQPGRSWIDHLSRTIHMRARLDGRKVTLGPTLVAANSSRINRFSGENWLAVGDAALAFDPLAGQGIYRALESGTQAGHVIRSHLSSDCSALADYDRALEGAFYDFLLLRTTYYGQEKRWPDSLFWRRRYSTQSEG